MKKVVCIFAGGQQGDVMSAMSVLKYRNELWGDNHRIIWYINPENRDLLAYQEDIELRDFPRGYGYAQMVIDENKKLIEEGKKPIWMDFEQLVDWNNRMNMALKFNYPELSEVTEGYFPLTHQMSPKQRHGLEYPNVSRKVFGVPMDWQWHPVLAFSDDEFDLASEFMHDRYLRPSIAIETFAGSGQSILNDAQVRKSMEICSEILGECNFVFVSNKYLRTNEQFPEDILNMPNTLFAGHFTVRQCTLIVELCDLLISVSSGITVAASCWGNTAVPIIQYCGSTTCSTRAMALGRFELITTDDNPMAEAQYYEALTKLLNEIK